MHPCAKVERQGSEFTRFKIEIPLPFDHSVNMNTKWGPERCQWDPTLEKIEILHVFEPDDIVMTMTAKVPTLVKWMLRSGNLTFTVRMKIARDYPEPGQVSFAIAPYDMATNTVMEEQGLFKGKSGTIVPHESDPAKSWVIGVERTNLNWVPDWSMGFFAEKVSLPMLQSLVMNYKKSPLYAEFEAQR